MTSLVIELSNIGTSYDYESDVHQLSTPLRPVSIVFNDRNLIQMVSENYWKKSLIVRISDKSEHVKVPVTFRARKAVVFVVVAFKIKVSMILKIIQ